MRLERFATMGNVSDFFRRRSAARNAASERDDGESAEVAGHLALAYAALRRRRAAVEPAEAIEPAVASVPDEVPLMLRD
jgi:hypothetical protein